MTHAAASRRVIWVISVVVAERREDSTDGEFEGDPADWQEL
jgi:hypothetical protein